MKIDIATPPQYMQENLGWMFSMVE